MINVVKVLSNLWFCRIILPLCIILLTCKRAMEEKRNCTLWPQSFCYLMTSSQTDHRLLYKQSCLVNHRCTSKNPKQQSWCEWMGQCFEFFFPEFCKSRLQKV